MPSLPEINDVGSECFDSEPSFTEAELGVRSIAAERESARVYVCVRERERERVRSRERERERARERKRERERGRERKQIRFRKSKRDVRLPGKGNLTSHGARPVHLHHLDNTVDLDQ